MEIIAKAEAPDTQLQEQVEELNAEIARTKERMRRQKQESDALQSLSDMIPATHPKYFVYILRNEFRPLDIMKPSMNFGPFATSKTYPETFEELLYHFGVYSVALGALQIGADVSQLQMALSLYKLHLHELYMFYHYILESVLHFHFCFHAKRIAF